MEELLAPMNKPSSLTSHENKSTSQNRRHSVKQKKEAPPKHSRVSTNDFDLDDLLRIPEKKKLDTLDSLLKIESVFELLIF